MKKFRNWVVGKLTNNLKCEMCGKRYPTLFVGPNNSWACNSCILEHVELTNEE